MANAVPTNKNFKDRPEDRIGQAAHQVGQTASNVADKARDAGASVMDRARDAAASVGRTASETASAIGDRAESATSSVGSGMQSLASTIRENAPREGMLGRASSSVAEGLESGGRYVKEEGISGMMEDLTEVVRRNPLPAVLVGIGVGFLLARLTSSSRS
jgi:ElaB/YqjD/DUF883 family membrane-anchored ribosome-binding protein